MKSEEKKKTKGSGSLKPVDDGKIGKGKKNGRVGAKRSKRDPNEPKRPISAYLLFLQDFRKENPHLRAVSAVTKAAGPKWKSMSDAEKSPYEKEAAVRRAEYYNRMQAYNSNKVAEVPSPGASDDDAESQVQNNEEDVESGEEVSGKEDESKEEDED